MNDMSSPNTISITVKVFGGLRQSFQGGTLIQPLPAESALSALIDQIKLDFPDLSANLKHGLEAGYLNILINGRNIRFLQNYETQLRDGDTVAFLPPVGGG